MEIEKKKIFDALENIGEINDFKNIKQACIKGHFNIQTQRLNEMDEILRCIKLYIILKDIKKLTGRKLEVLSYYLKFGYNKNTKKDILKWVRITDSNLNNINCRLRKMGVIHSVGYNQSSNEIDKELLSFKQFIVDEKGGYVLMKIV